MMTARAGIARRAQNPKERRRPKAHVVEFWIAGRLLKKDFHRLLFSLLFLPEGEKAPRRVQPPGVRQCYRGGFCPAPGVHSREEEEAQLERRASRGAARLLCQVACEGGVG